MRPHGSFGDLAISGLILAGGRSSRFGADKLWAELDGRPIVRHAIDALASCCHEVIVVGPATGIDLRGAGACTTGRVRLVLDAEPFPGPLAALVTGAAAATRGWVLATGGDMPFPARSVLDLMARRAVGDGRRIPSLIALAASPGGHPAPLPLLGWRDALVTEGGALLRGGERSIRSLHDRLDVTVIPEGAWRVSDPAGRTLMDVDRPEDLHAERWGRV